MADAFKTCTMNKGWSAGIWDDWNQPWGHAKRRNEGRKRIKRAARHKLKQELRRTINEL